MLTFYAVGLSLVIGRVELCQKYLKNGTRYFPAKQSTFWEGALELKNNGQPRLVAFTVLAQLFGAKDNETKVVATLFTKNCDRGFDFTVINV